MTAPLRDLGGGRVWSLMVSLFGDLAQEDGKTIDGPMLSAIMSLLQIKPEAVRVALHRLRNDGWISSRKAGRISRHGLTDKGRAESAAASPRIYAEPRAEAGKWQLLLLKAEESDLDEKLSAAGYTAIMPRVVVGPADAEPPAGALALQGTTAPDWLRQELRPAALDDAYADLHDTLVRLSAALPDRGALSPLEIAVLRCLVVHNWRRLILRHPMLPAPLVSAEGAGHRCHLRVADLLNRFPRPELHEIDALLAA